MEGTHRCGEGGRPKLDTNMVSATLTILSRIFHQTPIPSQLSQETKPTTYNCKYTPRKMVMIMMY